MTTTKKLTRAERVVRYLEAHGWVENQQTRRTKYREFTYKKADGTIHKRIVGGSGAVRRVLDSGSTISVTHVIWPHIKIWEARS